LYAFGDQSLELGKANPLTRRERVRVRASHGHVIGLLAVIDL
jgi:hypothetical protein